MADDESKTTLIEQTSKRLKKLRLIGMILIVVGIAFAFVLADEYGPTNTGYAIGGLFGAAGIGCWAYGMALTWWEHG